MHTLSDFLVDDRVAILTWCRINGSAMPAVAPDGSRAAPSRRMHSGQEIAHTMVEDSKAGCIYSKRRPSDSSMSASQPRQVTLLIHWFSCVVSSSAVVLDFRVGDAFDGTHARCVWHPVFASTVIP